MRIRIMKKRENESFLRKRTRLFFNFTFANLMNPFKFLKVFLLVPFLTIVILSADGVFNGDMVKSIANFLFAPATIFFNQFFPPQEYYILSVVLGVSVTMIIGYKTAQFLFFLLADFLGTKYFKREMMILERYDY